MSASKLPLWKRKRRPVGKTPPKSSRRVRRGSVLTSKPLAPSSKKRTVTRKVTAKAAKKRERSRAARKGWRTRRERQRLERERLQREAIKQRVRKHRKKRAKLRELERQKREFAEAIERDTELKRQVDRVRKVEAELASEEARQRGASREEIRAVLRQHLTDREIATQEKLAALNDGTYQRTRDVGEFGFTEKQGAALEKRVAGKDEAWFDSHVHDLADEFDLDVGDLYDYYYDSPGGGES